jgi:hypothetical protein
LQVLGMPQLAWYAQLSAKIRTRQLSIGSGGSRLNDDTPLPPTEPDWTLSSHPALPDLTSLIRRESVPAWRDL